MGRYGDVSGFAVFLSAVAVTGAVAGAFVWAVLFVMDLGSSVIWDRIPVYLGEFYPVIVCLVGGVVLGLFSRRFGDLPETLPQVMAKVRSEGRYDYRNIGPMSVGAVLPLVFGGSVGPEAGLSGVIAALCTWVGDRLRRIGRDIGELAEVGVYAALSAVFSAPLFGLTGAVEDRRDTPKAMRVLTYVFAIAGAFSALLILTHFIGGGMSLPRYPTVEYGQGEFLWMVPLCIIGGSVGCLFNITDRVSERVSERFGEKKVARAVTGGLVLGLCGMVLPFTMFSGEVQADVLNGTWMTMSAAVLVATGVVKVMVTAVCVNMGWRGGHFFPVIFSGISIGYGMSVLFGVDPVFSVCATAASILGAVMGRPVVTVLLLFLCFPMESLPVLLVAAFLGSLIGRPMSKTKGSEDL